MRPGSSKKKTNKSISYNRPSSAVKKKQKDQQPLSIISSQNVKSYESNTSNISRTRYREKVVVCESAKKIAMIHAYQPKLLKQCIVSNPKSYKQFYYENSGLCMISNLYTVSFMAHFREWRKNLRNKLFKIVGELLNFWSFVQSDQVNEVLNQLKYFSRDLQSETDVVSKQKELNLSKEASELNRKFAYLRQYGKELILIFKAFCEATKVISENLQQAFNNTKDVKVAKSQIKETAEIFKTNTFGSLNYCASHPESVLMNNAQYRINQRLKQIVEQAFAILKKIKLVGVFKKKLENVTNPKQKPEDYTPEILEQIIKVMGEHQEFKLNFNKGSNNQSEKFTQMVAKIQSQLNGLVLQFLNNFKDKLQLILEQQWSEIKKQKVETCLENKDTKFKICKKKMLLLTKIFHKRITPQIYEKISHNIKQTSENYQEISEIITKLQQMSKSSNNNSKNNLNLFLKQLLKLVEKFEYNRDKILEGIEKCLQRQNYHLFESNEPKESDRLKKLQKLIHFDENYLNSILVVPNDHIPTYPIKRQDLQKILSKNYQTIEILSTQKFPQIQAASRDLNELFNDSLVAKFLTLTTDLKKDPIYSFWIFIQFHKKLISVIENNLQKDVTKDSLQKMLTFFQQQTSKCETYKNQKYGVKFLQWEFENAIFKLLMNFTRQVQIIIKDPINNEYRLNSQNKELDSSTSFRNSQKIRGYIESRKKIIQYMLAKSNESTYIRSKSPYELYLRQLLKGIEEMIERQAIFQKFQRSAQLGNFEPIPATLQDWLKWEFSFCIQGSVNRSFIRNYRRQILGLFKNYVKRIESVTKDSKLQNLVGKDFVSIWESKIKNIEKFLIPHAEETSSEENNIKKYAALGKSLMRYLRISKVSHVGIFFTNQQPFTFFLEKSSDPFNEYLKTFEKMLSIPPIQRDDARSLFTPFQVDKEEKVLSIVVPAPAKVLPPPPPPTRQKPMFVLEEDIQQEQIPEDHAEISDPAFILEEDHVEISKPTFILEDKKGTKKIENKVVVKEQAKNYVYYKIQIINSLNKLIECFKVARSAPNLIKNQLKFQKLTLGFEQNQPNRQLCEHLETTIKQLKQNNLMDLFNKKNKTSQPEKILTKLLQALKSTNKSAQARNKRYSALKQALSLIGCDFTFIYDEGGEGNKIILCHNEQHENYAYAVLINDNPEEKCTNLLKDQQAVKIQNLFLKSLFSTPFQKNRNLDQIKSSISQIKIETCAQLKKDLFKYKEHKIKNANQIEEKVKKYLGQRTKEIKLTNPNIIDYTSYKQFLKEYGQLVAMQKGQQKLYKAYLNNDPNLPLCYTKKQPQIKTMLEPLQDKGRLYAILPRAFNNSIYVERSTFQITNVRLSDVVNHVIKNQLESVEFLHSQKSISALYSVGQSGVNNIFGDKKVSSVLEKTKLDQYAIITNSLQIIGEKDPIGPKLETLSKYKEFEDVIEKIIVNHAFFLLDQNQMDQQAQQNFMTNQTPVFIIGKPKPQVIFDNKMLEQVHQTLSKIGVKSKLVKYQSKTIGIAQTNESGEKIVNMILGVDGNEKIKYRQMPNKDIEIQDLYFYLKFSNNMQSDVDQSPKIRPYINKFWIQIKNGSTIKKIPNILNLTNNPLAIICDFPRKPIEISLCYVNENSEQVTLVSFKLKCYKYENTYILTSFENTVRRMIVQEIKRLQKQEKDSHQAKIVRIQVQQKAKRKFVMQNLQTQSYIDQEQNEEECIGNISFNLSEGFAFD